MAGRRRWTVWSCWSLTNAHWFIFGNPPTESGFGAGVRQKFAYSWRSAVSFSCNRQNEKPETETFREHYVTSTAKNKDSCLRRSPIQLSKHNIFKQVLAQSIADALLCLWISSTLRSLWIASPAFAYISVELNTQCFDYWRQNVIWCIECSWIYCAIMCRSVECDDNALRKMCLIGLRREKIIETKHGVMIRSYDNWAYMNIVIIFNLCS